MIDFFIDNCTETLNNTRFGLCDDPPPSNSPAYPDVTNTRKWIATVHNPNNDTVTFIAVDSCLDIRRSNGNLDSRCDAMLKYNSNIIFVELKDRDGSAIKWIKKAEKQLRITIRNFNVNHDLSSYIKKFAYISNIQHPNFRSSQKERMQTFKDDTGIRLLITATIDLSL